MRIVNVDMDGVVYDFHQQIHDFAEQYLGRTLPVADQWALHKSWGISNKQWERLFGDAVEDGVFFHGDPVDGALDAISVLAKNKFRVRFVTSKQFRDPSLSYKARVDTLTWLDMAGLGGFEVAFTNNKQSYMADVVIDDKPSLEWFQPNAHNVLFGQPWNAGTSIPPIASVKFDRLEGWDRVLDGVLG